MFDIKAVKRVLGITAENVEFETDPRAKGAKCANPERKVSTISTISTPPDLKSEFSEIDNHIEAAEERAAIMEYDGGLSRQEAEQYAIETHLRPFYFKTTDSVNGGVYLGRCATLEEAIKALKDRFGDKLEEVHPCQ